MALETPTHISDLVSTNPTDSDPKSQGAPHIRNLKAAIKATFPNINGAVTATDEQLNLLAGSTPLAWRNKVINGGFTVNQRKYVSGAVLAAGAFGHDRWKAGASGGDYTFTQLATATTITIAASKSLIQVIPTEDTHSATYVLSWTGTAQARYAVNSSTPSGSYAASPITITGQTPGQLMSIEFGPGTLGTVQLEAGSVATPYEHRLGEIEESLCRRYYRRYSSDAGNIAYVASVANYSTTAAMADGHICAGMRAVPTIGYSAIGDLYNWTAGGSVQLNSISIASLDRNSPNITIGTASSWTNGYAGRLYVVNGTGKYLDFSAEL